jgi:hypothetical protein
MQIKPQLLSILGWNIQGDIAGVTAYRSARQRFTWFAATTPKVQPSVPQALQRLLWTAAANAWTAMDSQTKQQWRDTARLAHLNITAYNLWIHCATTADEEILAQTAHETGITLTLQTRNI